jgi:hypothetical protein
LWLILLNLTLWFYGEQASFSGEATFFNLMLALNGLGLLLWEAGQMWGYDWLKDRWEPRLISLATFIFALIPTLGFIWSWHSSTIDNSLILGSFLYLVLTTLVVFVYTRYIHDLLMLTLAAFSLIIVITSAVGNELSQADFDISGLLLVIGLIIIIQVALAVNWLQRVARSWEAAHG